MLCVMIENQLQITLRSHPIQPAPTSMSQDFKTLNPLLKKNSQKTRPFKNTSPFAHSEARSLSAPPTPQRRRHPSPTGTDKPVGTWAPSDRIAMVGCPRTSHRPCLLMTTTANAHQSAAYDLMNVRTARTQHHRKNRGIKKHLKAHTSSTLCRPLCMPTHCMLSHVNLHLYVQCIVLL